MADYETIKQAAEAVELKNTMVKMSEAMTYGDTPEHTGSKDVKVEAKPHKESTTEQEVTSKDEKDAPKGGKKNSPTMVAVKSTTVSVKTAASKDRLQNLVDMANKIFSRV